MWDRWILLPHATLDMKNSFLVSDMKEKIFMQESDASNFLKRRGKRSPKSRDEANGKNAGWSQPLDAKVARTLNELRYHYLGPVR